MTFIKVRGSNKSGQFGVVLEKRSVYYIHLYLQCGNIKNHSHAGLVTIISLVKILSKRQRPGAQSEAVISLKQGICQSALLPRACFLLFLSHSWRPCLPHTRRPVQHLPQARWWCRRRQEQQKPARTICCSRCRLIVSVSQGSGGACQRYLGGNKYLHSAAALSREQP